MFLMLCAVVPSDSRSPVAEAVSGGPELRLTYVFNPEIDVHLERALQVQALVRSAASQISVLGVVRGDLDATPLQLQRGDRTIEFDIVSENGPRADGVITWLALNPGPREDHFILEDAIGVRLQGAGSELGRLDAALSPVTAMTKVEVNTWGKVKELFR